MVAWRVGGRRGGQCHDGAEGGGGSSRGGRTAGTSSLEWRCGPRHMVGATLEAPPVAVSENRSVGVPAFKILLWAGVAGTAGAQIVLCSDQDRSLLPDQVRGIMRAWDAWLA